MLKAHESQRDRKPLDLNNLGYLYDNRVSFRDPLRRIEMIQYSEGDESDINSVGSDISDTDIPSIVNINNAIGELGDRRKMPGLHLPDDALSKIMDFIPPVDDQHRQRARKRYRERKRKRFRTRHHKLRTWVKDLGHGTDTEEEWDELDDLHETRYQAVELYNNEKEQGSPFDLEPLAHLITDSETMLKQKILAHRAAQMARMRLDVASQVKPGYEHTLGPPGLKKYGKWFDIYRKFDDSARMSVHWAHQQDLLQRM